MFENYAELQKLSDEELIQKYDRSISDLGTEYDRAAIFNQVGPRHFLSVLDQRHQTRQTEAILVYTKVITGMILSSRSRRWLTCASQFGCSALGTCFFRLRAATQFTIVFHAIPEGIPVQNNGGLGGPPNFKSTNLNHPVRVNLRLAPNSPCGYKHNHQPFLNTSVYQFIT